MRHSSIVLILRTASVLFSLLADTAVAAGDPARGAREFLSCTACHSVKAGEHSTGPSLANLWSRKAGTADGFPRYSEALKGADLVWDERSLDRWLHDPRQLVPGTSMAFQGIKDAQERADVIAYLKAVSENVAPPAPPQGSMMGARQRRAK